MLDIFFMEVFLNDIRLTNIKFTKNKVFFIVIVINERQLPRTVN